MENDAKGGLDDSTYSLVSSLKRSDRAGYDASDVNDARINTLYIYILYILFTYYFLIIRLVVSLVSLTPEPPMNKEKKHDAR